jgi:hypothetical protein
MIDGKKLLELIISRQSDKKIATNPLNQKYLTG